MDGILRKNSHREKTETALLLKQKTAKNEKWPVFFFAKRGVFFSLIFLNQKKKTAWKVGILRITIGKALKGNERVSASGAFGTITL